MSATTDVDALLAERDPDTVARAMPLLRLATRAWFRSEVHDVDRIPDGAALVVSNHSGGLLAMDVPVFAVAFTDTFGPDRPLYCLAHDMMFTGAAGPVFRRCGFVPARRDIATAVLDAGAVTIVFPGGDHDVFRPTSQRNVIDFDGRTGYVHTALATGAPIVPMVSIGGHEDQLHLTRGEAIGRRLGLEKLLRSRYFPISFGFPFGLTAAFPPNLPLPTKIVSQVLAPIDPTTFGDDPDPAEIDAEVRRRMQDALDELARRRRFPVLG